MGAMVLQDKVVADTAGGSPTYTVHRQWVMDFSAFAGSDMDVRGAASFAPVASGTVSYKVKHGGTSDTDDGTEILAATLSAAGLNESLNPAIAFPSGAQLVKLLTTSTAGGGTMRGVAITLIPDEQGATVCFDGGMEAVKNAPTGATLIRTFAISPDALPGTGNLSCRWALHHSTKPSAANIVIREGGTYNTADGTSRSSVAMSSGAGPQASSFTLTRPTAASQLKICIEDVPGGESVDIFGLTLIMVASGG